MNKFISITSPAIAWLMPNVDTDIIIPMKRLLLNMDELGKYSFEPFRFVDGDGDKGELNMDFPLNQPLAAVAKIMIVGENFGCGSSREVAAEAILHCGIRCLIGSSFGGIFVKNCFQQGILPISLPVETVRQLAELSKKGGLFTVDLSAKTITAPDGQILNFVIDDFRRRCLMEGLDDVDITLKSKETIDSFFSLDSSVRTWLY